MPPRKKNRSGEYAERRRERLANKLSALEDYHATVPASLRRMLENKAKPEDILEFAASLAAARLVTEVGSTHAPTAMDAAKQILDRTQGKAVERIAQVHKFEGLPEDQLDSLIKSRAIEAGLIGKPQSDDDVEA